jgi:hypothetical protein
VVSSKDSSVIIQTSSQSVPSTPSWFGEVTVIAHYLEHLGVLSDISGTAPLTGEYAQATLQGRPRGRFGRAGSQAAPLRRLVCFGWLQGAGAIL